MEPSTTIKMRLLLAGNVAVAAGSIIYSLQVPGHNWIHFAVYLAMVLAASGLRVKMPGGDSTISINFPFILLSIIESSPIEALLIAGISVLVQCTRKGTRFTPEQIIFNVSNSVFATAAAWFVYLLVLRSTDQLPPAVAAATLTYSAVNALIVARMLGWAVGARVLDVLKQGFIDCIPYYLFAGAMATIVALISSHFGWLSSQLIFPVAWACYRTVTFYMNRQEERKEHLEQLALVHMRTIEALAMAIEAKDQNTHGHLCRVRVYVGEIGAEMHLPEPEMQALLAGSLLHDIGKLAVPEHIITKPGKLTPEEFEKMKIHPVVGADILERVGFPYPVSPIVRSHHERWDGKGYPDGLAGTDIPIGARILSVVDCFDALVSDRPYRPAIPLEEAMRYVHDRAGTQFDSNVVEVLERRYLDLELKAKAEGAKMIAPKTPFIMKGGEAPAAGFEKSNGLAGPFPTPGKIRERRKHQNGPLASIAAAGHEAQVLYQLSQTLGNSLSMDETLSAMGTQLRRLIAYDCFAMYLMEGDHLAPVHSFGEDHQFFLNLSVPVGEGVSGWVALSHMPIVNGNPDVELAFHEPKVTSRLRSVLAIPLEKFHDGKHGHVFGVLALYSIQQDAFSRDHLRVLQAVIEKTARSIENSLKFRRVESEALTDYLTGILNSRGFMLEAERVIMLGEKPLALIACDLDDFKSVNDTEGHLVGDQVLRAVADIFVSLCGPNAVLARLGGDEFAAFIPGLDESEIDELLDQMVLAIEKVSAQILPDRHISASMGAAFLGADGTSVGQLAELADRRMYAMKRSDGSNHRILQMVQAAS